MRLGPLSEPVSSFAFDMPFVIIAGFILPRTRLWLVAGNRVEDIHLAPSPAPIQAKNIRLAPNVRDGHDLDKGGGLYGGQLDVCLTTLQESRFQFLTKERIEESRRTSSQTNANCYDISFECRVMGPNSAGFAAPLWWPTALSPAQGNGRRCHRAKTSRSSFR